MALKIALNKGIELSCLKEEKKHQYEHWENGGLEASCVQEIVSTSVSVDSVARYRGHVTVGSTWTRKVDGSQS